jgi:plasmid stability protein
MDLNKMTNSVYPPSDRGHFFDLIDFILTPYDVDHHLAREEVSFMARINIRELPDHIHKAISESADRNNRSTEGEVRSILQAYVSSLEPQPAPIETLRQSWQKGVGNRLDQLFACLRKD